MKTAGIVGLMLAIPISLCAQEVDTRPAPLFLERSYLFSRMPVDDLAFEGQIAPHLYFTRSDAWQRGDVLIAPQHFLTVSFTPLVRLRMLSTESFPVRTPSYMPRPLLDWQWIRASAADTDPVMRMEGTAARRAWGLTFTPWAHHSNGQDGCLYEHQIRDEAGNCIGELPEETTRPTTNKIDGSFSTNFLRLGIGYAYAGPAVAAGDYLELRNKCSVHLDVEYHPLEYLVGGLAREQERFYPQVQVELGTEWTGWWRGMWLVGLNTRWFDHTAPGVGNFAHSAEVNFSPRGLEGWGLFSRFYRGMDYYNLGFMDRIGYLQFGVVWDLGSVPRVRGVDVIEDTQLPPYPQNRVLDGWLPRQFDRLCRRLH